MGIWTKSLCVIVLGSVLIISTGCPSSTPQQRPNPTKANTNKATNLQANEIADSLDIPLDIAIPLLKLHRRFGHLDTAKLATSGLIIGLMSDDQQDYLRESIQVTRAALKSSNAEQNLGAPPKPTGDGLFDTYAEAVFKQIEAIPWAEVNSDEAMYAAALPDAVIAAWEPEFEHDPRYWELRYFCAMFYPGNNPLVGDFENRIDFLRYSQESDVATANTLLLLYEELVLEKENEEGVADREEFTPNAKALEVLDEAIGTWPDECWPWYYRALHNFSSGKMELALSDLKQGNKAVINVYPRPYPFSFVEKHFGGKSPSGSALISGAILLTAQPYRLPNLIKWKKFQKNHWMELLTHLELNY